MFGTAESFETSGSGECGVVADFERLAAWSREAATLDMTTLSDDELLAVAEVVEAKRASDEAAWAHVAAELDARRVSDREVGLTTATWLAHITHGSRPVLAGRVKAAVALRPFPTLDDALAHGLVTPEHARVVTTASNPRIEADLIALQDELVDLARRCPFPAWRRHVVRLAELLDQDGGFDPDRDLARNHLRLSPTGTDAVGIAGELVGEQALSFTRLVEAEADRLWRRHHRDYEQGAIRLLPSRHQLRALALVELVTRGATATGGGPVVDISLVVHQIAPDRAVAPDGTVLTGDRLDHLRCDAAITPLVIDDDGVPIAVGRTQRHATPAQRRALTVRDGGCVFPGCDLPATWCDAHHVTPWEHGGSTELHNLALLCRHHHGVTHRRGWAMVAHADQTFTWTTPTGRALQSQRNRGAPAP